jgi:hypothetical protein
MPKKGKNSGIWAYLEAAGVLENGTEEDIKKVKRAYRKEYILNYRRKQRTEKPEYIIGLSKKKGEYFKILCAAKEHKMAMTSFIRAAALAYAEQKYIVPDRLQIGELKQLLSSCLNEIQLIVKQKEKYFWGKEQKFKDIEKRMEKLEEDMSVKLERPITIEEAIKKEIEKDPAYQERLINSLNRHDH